MDTSKLVYGLSFAELCDRGQIVLLKIINSDNYNEALSKELFDILTDIQQHINEKPITAEMLRGIMVLGFVNNFIFTNESIVRDEDFGSQLEDEKMLEILKKSHKANSLRAEAKKYIQQQRNERQDPKLNYGKNEGMWNIDFNKINEENEQWRYM